MKQRPDRKKNKGGKHRTPKERYSSKNSQWFSVTPSNVKGGLTKTSFISLNPKLCQNRKIVIVLTKHTDKNQ